MWPQNRRKKPEDSEKISESVAYDEVSKDLKYSEIVMVYDDMDILLFNRPRKRISRKKV